MVNASWLIKLRWVAVIGQLMTISIVISFLGIDIANLWSLWVVIGLTAFSNLVLTLLFAGWSSKSDPRPLAWDLILGLVMIMDMLSLTALLFATGGTTNPFCLFFFVNLSLCAMVLDPGWAWSLYCLSLACFATLFVEYHEIETLRIGFDLAPLRQSGSFSLYQLGLLTAFATCGGVLVYFVTRLTAELQEQQQEIEHAMSLQARSEKLEALGTLAAGTAHELATPLSTIAVVAKDVEQAFDEHPPEFPGAEDVIDDIHLIRSQLDRCRNILDRMASHSGQAIGENMQSVTLRRLVDEILGGIETAERIEVQFEDGVEDQKIHGPIVLLSQALRGLLQNALDADPNNNPVYLSIRSDLWRNTPHWQWTIRDAGQGMPPEILERVSEPFFTTKSPGKGMGLGVFLAQNVIQKLDGHIEFISNLNRGTQVTIYLKRP